MKLRYFLTSILACLALAIGCTQEELPGLTEIEVTPSYFTLPMAGGDYEVVVDAEAAWEVKDIPAWVTVNPSKGNGSVEGGEKVKITVAASTSDKAKAAYLKFNCAGKTKLVTVNQEAYVPDFPVFKEGEYWIAFGEEVATPVNSSYGYLYTTKATVSEDGKISSTADNIFTFKAVDGGFTIQDPAGMYYYMKGTYTSFNLDAALPETGGVWTVKQTGDKTFLITNANGKFMQYDPAYSSAGAYDAEKSGGIWPNLVNTAGAEVAEVMFAVEPKEFSLEKAAGEFVVKMTCKNEGFEVNPSADWITLKGMTSKDGEYDVTFSYTANESGPRNATIDFVSNEETISVKVEQAGSAEEMTLAELSASVLAGATSYNAILTDAVVSYVNGSNAFIEDASGAILLYNKEHGLKAGQKISGIVAGVAKNYENLPELTSMDYSAATVTEGATIPCTELTIAELLANYNKYISCRVLIKGVTVTDGLNLADDRDGVIAQGENKVNLRSQDKNTIVVEADQVGDLICYPTIYKENQQVGIWQNSDFTATAGGETPAVTLDGKQWMADMGGMKLLVDLGASEDGMMLVALPAETGTGYELYMAGTYVATPTDETSGTILFTPMDLETEQFDTPVSLPYSGLTATSVNVTSADLFEVETPVAFTKVEEYIDIAVPGEGGGGDVTENSIENGVYWIANLDAKKAAAPLAEDKTYGYLPSDDMVEGASYAKNAFTFTYNANETKYTIQDSYGRYLYNATGEYNTFNVSAELPAAGAYWSVVANGDGTYDIYNEIGFSIQYSSQFGSWEAKLPTETTIYPSLVKADNPVAEPEPEPQPQGVYNWTLANGDLGTVANPASSVTKGTPELTWTVSSTPAVQYLGFDKAKGLQFGSKNAPLNGTLTLTTTATGLTVSKVVVNSSMASGGDLKVAVYVNGTQVGETTSVTTSAADYTFALPEAAAGAEVKVELSNTIRGAYLKSIIFE